MILMFKSSPKSCWHTTPPEGRRSLLEGLSCAEASSSIMRNSRRGSGTEVWGSRTYNSEHRNPVIPPKSRCIAPNSQGWHLAPHQLWSEESYGKHVSTLASSKDIELPMSSSQPPCEFTAVQDCDILTAVLAMIAAWGLGLLGDMFSMQKSPATRTTNFHL